MRLFGTALEGAIDKILRFQVMILVTIKEVAERANASTSSVSRVMNNTAYVSLDVRQRVLAAMKELNYVPNSHAQSLKGNRTRSIALLIPDICNDAYPLTIQGIEEYTRKINYNILLGITNDDLELERLYVERFKHQVDGFIVCTMTPQSVAVFQLKRENIPTVLVAREYDQEFDSVIVDNYNGAFNATRYLCNIGKKKILLVSGDVSIRLYQQRLNGYRDALIASGIQVDPKRILYEPLNKDALLPALISFLKENTVDAIFATSDEKAMTSMRALGECGLKIPADVAVLGFDNIRMSKLANPPLSTMAQPFGEMGILAVQKLIERIERGESSPPVVDVMKTELIIRGSTE